MLGIIAATAGKKTIQAILTALGAAALKVGTAYATEYAKEKGKRHARASKAVVN